MVSRTSLTSPPSFRTLRLFRHVGIMEINGKPVFDGFYPLKIK